MKMIGWGLGFILAVVMTALVQSWGASVLWRWFIARDYGAGPSYAAWYGLFTIIGLAQLKQYPAKTQAKGEKKAEESPTDVITKFLVAPIMILMTLALAGVVRAALGW